MDEITARLLEVLQKNELLRIYAKTTSLQSVNPGIREIANIVDEKIEFPSLSYIYQFRVVLTTLQTAGIITRSRSKEKQFKSTHFAHVIIDEAASVQETMTWIPIAGEVIIQALIIIFFFELICFYFICIATVN